MKSESREEINFKNETKNKFWSIFENTFVVLPDEKTIVGVDTKIESTLVVEDMTTNKSASFGKNENYILNLLYDKVSETLFAGDSGGYIKQYKRSRKIEPFSLVKDYGNVGIQDVFSSAQVGRYAFFGGFDRSVVAINIDERQLCKGKIESPFESTFSLQACRGSRSKFYLSLGGANPDYISNTSDFLDVTGIYENQKMVIDQDDQEVNEMLIINPQKVQKNMTYESKIKKLGLDFSQEKFLKENLPGQGNSLLKKKDLLESQNIKLLDHLEVMKNKNKMKTQNENLQEKQIIEEIVCSNFYEPKKSIKEFKTSDQEIESNW